MAKGVELLKGAVIQEAKSVAGKPLPTPGPEASVLFYQYIEPSWSEKEHKAALTYIINLARKHKINGRGRCAAEGLNCTLSGFAADIRAFCMGLREWNPIFNNTDFKITDGIYYGKRFKALTIRKTEELVAYGLAGERAPSLNQSVAQHLEADDYHKMMAEDNTVIIDVRNHYESAIGHFKPPEGGAELIDPKLRNSYEFPKWLNLPETKQKLEGKKVMMYCTGGIRCERASALVDQMEKAADGMKTEGVYMVRGGIERYMKTFPEGGFWKGKNYLFDRRFEQVPEKKSEEALQKDVTSKCCLCAKPWDLYRGQFKCVEKLCKVPVLVCYECADAGVPDQNPTYCPLCMEGHHLRDCAKPDTAGQKRALFGTDITAPQGEGNPEALKGKKAGAKRRKVAKAREATARLFVGNLPLSVTARSLRGALGGGTKSVTWVTDKSTGGFYGSAFVKMESVEAAQKCVDRAAGAGKGGGSEGNWGKGAGGIRLAGGGRKARLLRVGFAAEEAGEGVAGERPPIGKVA